MSSRNTSVGTVALFNASDDTVEMIEDMLVDAGDQQTLIWCHFADLKNGVVVFEKYMAKHNPEVVIFDLSPPYDANWRYFKTMRDSATMRHRGIVLTTTNKARLDEVLGEDSHALEVVGRLKDLEEISAAIHEETTKARSHIIGRAGPAVYQPAPPPTQETAPVVTAVGSRPSRSSASRKKRSSATAS